MRDQIEHFASILIPALLFIAGFFLFRSCHPIPSPIPLQVSASVSALSTSAASQSIRITIRRPSTAEKPNDIATPASPQKTTQQAPAKGLLGKVARLFHPTKQATGLPEPLSSLSATVANNATVGEVITIEMGQSMAASAVGVASASVIVPSSSTHQVSSIGVIAGTLPGVLAVDLQIIKLGPVGVDLAANHRSVSAGISAGGKCFGLAGGYQAFDGGRGVFAGAGVRF